MADDVRELLVRVSATTELLRSQLTSAEREVSKFEKSTEMATRRVESNFNRMGQGVTASAGAQRAGMQQLTMQIGDMATMYSLGAKPMQIFASQGAQIIGALQLMSGGASKFAMFMGGPWGALITAGTLILAPLIANLFSTEDAADAAAGGTDRLTDALKRLKAEQGSVADEGAALVKISRLQEEALNPKIRNARGESPDSRAKRQAARRSEIQAEISELQQQVRWNEAVRTSRERASAPTPRKAASPSARAQGSRAAPKAKKEEWDDKWYIGQIADGIPEITARIREAAEGEWDKFNDRIKNVFQDQQEVREANLKRLADIEARQIDWLAGTYERLFKGGTKAIWGDFKQLGLTVVAQVLAKFTQARLSGKGGFDLSEAVSSSITSALGFGGFFANGGRPPLGKVSVVGENGPELFVPNVAGTIVPNGGFGGGGGVAVTIHAPGATGETVALIRREIAGAIPAIAQAATANTMRQSSRRRL